MDAPLHHGIQRAKVVASPSRFPKRSAQYEPYDDRFGCLDIAKSCFQVHGVDEHGKTALQKRLRRTRVLGYFVNLPPCLIGIEACASAHHWARELSKLGHEVKFMPPQFVKPYVKTNKNDPRGWLESTYKNWLKGTPR